MFSIDFPLFVPIKLYFTIVKYRDWGARMKNCIGIRRETKDKTQRRAPLTPEHVRTLIRDHRLRVIVQPWENRVFSDREYKRAGAEISEDLSPCSIIFGVKEVAPSLLLPGKAYVFFSHTVKGQSYNMEMLQTIVDGRNTLFDYELVKNSEGKRLIFFGDYAGRAGMIDSLWALGQRLKAEGIHTPFSSIRYASEYRRLHDAKESFLETGERITKKGLPKSLLPLIVGFTGYGNVTNGALEMFDLLPVHEIASEDLERWYRRGWYSNNVVYKVQYKKHDLYRHKEKKEFDLDEFNTHPDRYASGLEPHLPFYTMLVNGIYWEPRYPRIVTKRAIKNLFSKERKPRLKVIGDITCDIDGSVQLTVKETNQDNPVYVYEAATGRIKDGVRGRGPVVLSVDKLPTELPYEASYDFGTALLPFVPHLARHDYSRPVPVDALPREFRDAMIVRRGRLTNRFSYLKKHLP